MRKTNMEAENKHWLAKLLKFPILGCSYILKKAGNAYAEGSWYGNDTISKTIVDLNRIAIYADKTGKIRTTRRDNDYCCGYDSIGCKKRDQ